MNEYVKNYMLSGVIDDDAAADAVCAINSDDVENLWINCTGGCVTSALAIADAVRRRKITVIATGACYSVANIILAASNQRYATPSTIFHMHPLVIEDDEEPEVLQQVISKLLGPSLSALLMPAGPKWFNAKEAHKVGLVIGQWPPSLNFTAAKVIPINQTYTENAIATS